MFLTGNEACQLEKSRPIRQLGGSGADWGIGEVGHPLYVLAISTDLHHKASMSSREELANASGAGVDDET